MKEEKCITFTSLFSGRVDRASEEIPRSVFSLPDTVITVNGRPVKKSQKVKEGDSVTVKWTEDVFSGLEAEEIHLDVIYEDDSILVINKPSGMTVHPGAGCSSGTVANALVYRYGDDFQTQDDEDAELRPGIVHRLDKDTSGVLITAKTREAHIALASQFASHTNEKIYIAICKGNFERRRGTVTKNIVRSDKNRKTFNVTDNPEKGRTAITHYTVLRQFLGYAFVRIRIETGRTHQIRVHMKSIGHPVLGDPIYSRPDDKFDVPLCLHAASLTVDHPVTGERMTFRAKLSAHIRNTVLELIRRGI